MKSYLNKAMKDKYFLALLALFIVGIFLRFYKLEGFVTFLGDQGRDAIVIKRILLFEHFPAIGAPMSIGGVYLGPFYYYFIAPWLLLFNFNPIGLAFGVAFFSSLFILINYYIVKEFFDKKIALVSSFIICFSSLLIEFSRFSWNPNLLPLFSILFVYSFIKAVLEKKYIWFIFAGSVLALTIQLHYLALLLGVPTIIILIWEFVRDKSKKLSIILGTALMGLGFLFFSLPLIIFDLRHQFLNTNNFLKLLNNPESQAGNKIESLQLTLTQLNSHLFNVNLPIILCLLFVLLILIFAIIYHKESKKLYFSIFTLSMLLALSLYAGERQPHYYATILPLYIISLSSLIAALLKNKIGIIIGILTLILFVYSNSRNYYFFYLQPSNQISNAKKIAKVIYDNVNKEKFAVTAVPLNYIALPPRYFIEFWGKKPTEQDSAVKSDELFVICEAKCHPIGDPQWDIAFFAPNKIVGTWKVDNVTIYKLIR